MNVLIEGIKLIGGIAGIVALALKFFEEMYGYLRIKVEVKNENNQYAVFTEVENISRWSRKEISNALLIITPENSGLLGAGNRIAQQLGIEIRVNCTNDFEHFKSEVPIYIDRSIALIPLSFYYSENIAIGDEKLTYCCSVEKNKLNPGRYSVRFYIFSKGRYHRSTQNLLTIDDA